MLVALKGTVPGGAMGAALVWSRSFRRAHGANFAFEATSFFDDKGPPSGRQLLLAIDPAACRPDVFLDRFAVLASAIEQDPGARPPGTRRLALREVAARDA